MKIITLSLIAVLIAAGCATAGGGGGGGGGGTTATTIPTTGDGAIFVLGDSTGAGSLRYTSYMTTPNVNFSVAGTGYLVRGQGQTFLERAVATLAKYKVKRFVVVGGVNDLINTSVPHTAAQIIAGKDAFVQAMAARGVPVTIVGAAYTLHPSLNAVMAELNANIVSHGGTDCGLVLGNPLRPEYTADAAGVHPSYGLPQELFAHCVDGAL